MKSSSSPWGWTPSTRSSKPGNASTTPSDLTRPSATLPPNSSFASGNLSKRRPSVTNLLDECKRYQCLMICGTTIGGKSVGLEAAGSDGAKASG